MKPTPTSKDSGLSERQKNFQGYINTTRTSRGFIYCNPLFVPAGQDFDRNQGNQSCHDSTILRPEYASYKARLATFNDWPEAESQRPQLLAKAGFYYTGRLKKRTI
ncbi:IAP3-like protein [Mya arenaria]|uniref:IAP3-like protein n=1 Tax=Mya arenaria TaxID=6604 RepID=A0ABY7ED87_MYAAR|nr:IAP3-like protein [Mya arenaria]